MGLFKAQIPEKPPASSSSSVAAVKPPAKKISWMNISLIGGCVLLIGVIGYFFVRRFMIFRELALKEKKRIEGANLVFDLKEYGF